MAKRKLKITNEGNTVVRITAIRETQDPQPIIRKSDRAGAWKSEAHRGEHENRELPHIFSRKTGLLFLLVFLAVSGISLYFLHLSKVVPSHLPEEYPAYAQPVQMELAATPPKRAPRAFYKVQPGDTASNILMKHGLGSDIAMNLQKSWDNLKNSSPVPPTFSNRQELQLTFSSESQLKELRSEYPKIGEVVFRRQMDGSFKSQFFVPSKEQRERLAVGIVQSSFVQAASDAGMPYEIIDEFVDLFSDRVAFHRDMRVNDRFAVIYEEEVLDNGEAIKFGPVLAAMLEVNNKRLIAVRYVGSDGKARFFNELGELLGESFLRYPLKFSRISSHFSYARFHPVLKKKRPHNGVDFAAPIGTPVRTVANGQITFAGRSGASGIMVRIDHNDRYTTAYLHLSKLAPGIRRGVSVQRGQVIGAVGATGLATGPHLHYSFYDRGKYVDPLKVKLPAVEELHGGTKINPEYLQRAVFTLDHYKEVELNTMFGG